MSLILSKKSDVSGTLVKLRISPMISLKFFFVRTTLKNLALLGTTSLNKTRPTVVLIIFELLLALSSKSFILIFII